MRHGTKLGWSLIALSLVVSIWFFMSGSTMADYTDDQGFVYNDDQTELISAPDGVNDYNLPDTVVSIADNAFENSDVANIYIGDGSQLTTMGNQGDFFNGQNHVDIVVNNQAIIEYLNAYNSQLASGGFSVNGVYYPANGQGGGSGDGGSGDGGDQGGGQGGGVTVLRNLSVVNAFYDAAGNPISSAVRNGYPIQVADGTTVSFSADIVDGYTYRDNNISGGSSTADVTVNGADVTVVFNYVSGGELVTPEDPQPENPTPNPPSGGGGDSGSSGGVSGGGSNVSGSGGDPACSHVFTEWTTFAPATQTTGEQQARVCVVCGHRQIRVVTKYYVDPNGNITSKPKPGTGGSYTTPKTADGFDSRYLLSVAILLGGVGVILFSRQKKLSIITERINNK